MSEEKVQERVIIDNASLEYLIQKAVDAGRTAERREARKKRNPFLEEDERRLYSYPDLKIKITDDRKDIADMEMELECNKRSGNERTKSKDIVFIPTGGVRLDFEDKQNAIIEDKRASMLRTQKEIDTIDKAIETLSYKDAEKTICEEWIDVIKLKYFKGISPEQIAELMHCEKTTVYRNCNRIMNRLRTLWHGADQGCAKS